MCLWGKRKPPWFAWMKHVATHLIKPAATAWRQGVNRKECGDSKAHGVSQESHLALPTCLVASKEVRQHRSNGRYPGASLGGSEGTFLISSLAY